MTGSLQTPLRANGIFILDAEGKKIAEAISPAVAVAIVSFVNAAALQ